ncbi:hypothetical protein GHO29_17580 [Pseudomonas helleri]|uniref:Lipoprotein n=1 Tax=Pseudomonas helleri TaxID=1608996 RepID=A0A7X1Y0F0_9PSED|nr:hypothetical protein [Pseudomonas helleri]
MPLRISCGSALALAAGQIVVLIGCFFNRHSLNVGVGPRIKLQSVEPDTLCSDREFPNVWSNGFIEFVSAHAEIAVCLSDANKAREEGGN